MSRFEGESQEPAQQPVHPRASEDVVRRELLAVKIKIWPLSRATPPMHSTTHLRVKWIPERVCLVKHWTYWIEVLAVLRSDETGLDFTFVKERVPLDRCAGHRHATALGESQRVALWPSLANPLGTVRIHFLGDAWRNEQGFLWTPYVELSATGVRHDHTWHEGPQLTARWLPNDYVAIIRDIHRP